MWGYIKKIFLSGLKKSEEGEFQRGDRSKIIQNLMGHNKNLSFNKNSLSDTGVEE